MKKNLPVVCILALIGLLIAQGENAILYSKDALFLCADMIIPSLFPFFICSGILIYSGFCQRISVLFSPVMKPLFNVNPNGSSAFVLGIISGYPLGAVTACQLYESGYISKSETERLLAFCNNSGPLFILGSLGIGLYMGLDIGILLYVSHILGAILVGICMRFYKSERHCAPDYKLTTQDISFAEAFRLSVKNATDSMLIICGTILFFSVASRLFIDLIPFQLPPFIYGLFEFSSGNVIIALSDYNISSKLIMASLVTGFAGLSVHMQVLAVTSAHHLDVKPYFIGKILHGIFSCAITGLLISLFKISPVIKMTAPTMSYSFTMASLNIIVCVITIILLLSLIKPKTSTRE